MLLEIICSQFTKYACKGNRSVIYGVVLVTFFKDRADVSMFPVCWDGAC